VTATAADVRTNELIDAQNNLTKGLQDQGGRFDDFDSQMSKLTEELKNFEAQAGDGGKGGFLIESNEYCPRAVTAWAKQYRGSHIKTQISLIGTFNSSYEILS